jgi:DNA-binding XRE family transcriptional regulator
MHIITQIRLIKTEENYFTIQKVIDSLIDQDELNQDERDYLNLLGTLIVEYYSFLSRRRVNMTNIPSVNDIIKSLMEDDQEIQDYLTKMSLNSKIGELIYEARIKANLTQEELGELIGVSAEIIDDLELANYEDNALLMLQKIANVLEQKVKLELLSLGG